jgi:hypothetical protein
MKPNAPFSTEESPMLEDFETFSPVGAK